jgi:hypothetical protein
MGILARFLAQSCSILQKNGKFSADQRGRNTLEMGLEVVFPKVITLLNTNFLLSTFLVEKLAGSDLIFGRNMGCWFCALEKPQVCAKAWLANNWQVASIKIQV